MVKPVKGIPIGGPSSSYLLEVATDRWEYAAACRIRDLAVHHTPQARQLAKRLAKNMRWYFRYAGDIITLAEESFPDMMWNHSRPACHRASPLWIYPLRDSHNEQQLSLKLDVNTSDGDHLSAHYLCLTITLESPQNGKRVLTLAPYNKRHLFNFVFPMLTQWNSYTTTAKNMEQ